MAKRSFSIQSFRQNKDTVDVAAARRLWQSLENAIAEIYNQNASHLSFEELYRNAYNLVLHKHYDLLYNSVRETIRDHLQVSLIEIVEAKNEHMLSALVAAWNFHKMAFNMMKDILMYMDRAYCLPRKKATVYTLALQLFREVIARDTVAVNERMKQQLLEEIRKERSGEVIDRSLLKNVLSMLVELGVDGEAVYEVEFEGVFLEVTRQFYKVESLQFLSENTCTEYVLKAESRLAEEAARVQQYVPVSSESKLLAAVEQELIAVHAKTLLEMEGSGFVCMLRDNKLSDLKRLYALFLRVPHCLEQLRDAMSDYVKQCGAAVVAAQAATPQRDAVGFVRAVLDLKDKFDSIIEQCFRGEKRAQKKLQDAFEEFVNRDHQCASHLAAYVDDLLRGGIQGATEAEVEEKLEKVIVLFKFLADKDVFESYYKSLLSKRLLAGKSTSDEVEKSMISKLKAECGYQYTSKLEGMFMDMNVSKSVQEEFRASSAYRAALALTATAAATAIATAANPSSSSSGGGGSSSGGITTSTTTATTTAGGVEMEVHVLTTGYWPLQPSTPCELPPQLLRCTEIFSGFYLEKNNGRRLAWLTQLGSVDVKANFPLGRKELNVSPFQICLLMQFNEAAVVSLQRLKERTRIPELELKRHLLSLCTPKLRILKKSSKGKGIEPDDEFTFNDEFSSKFKRIKVPLVSVKEVMTAAEAAAATGGSSSNGSGSCGDDSGAGSSSGGGGIPAMVEEDRRLQLEAAIVRIMKSRKFMTHNDLVAEATRQLSQRFVPNPQFIKKRVESLIEREYIKRSESDSRVYEYLA